MTIERNFSTAATEFQRRFHISADNENRHRSSINQVILITTSIIKFENSMNPCIVRIQFNRTNGFMFTIILMLFTQISYENYIANHLENYQ